MKRNAELMVPMDYQEVDDIPFDFSAGIDDDETISSAAMECTVETGEDPSPSDFLIGDLQVGRLNADNDFIQDSQGRVILQRVGPGQPNVLYCLRCKIILSSQRKLVVAGHLPVIRL